MTQHFLTTDDWSREELQAMIDQGRLYRDTPMGDAMRGKSIALLFFNPSLRTRASFELGAFQLGGHAIVLAPGKDAWPMEFELGAIMDGNEEEHVQEAARVLSRYVDIIAIRAFPKFENWGEDRKDKLINAFAKFATVPVINMETIVHPCQELAMMMAVQDKLGEQQNKKMVLSWTYHPRPLNTAVANSALMIATKFGMDVTLLCPNEDYILDERYMNAARTNADEQGGSLSVSHNIEDAYTGADFVYAKSWGALPYFGNWEEEKQIRDANRHFIVDEAKINLTNNAFVSHCLPMRRNVKITDAVADSDRFIAIDEAENRLHVQKAIMGKLLAT